MPTLAVNTAKHQDAGEPNWFGSAAYDRLSRVSVALIFALLVLANPHSAIQAAPDWDRPSLAYTLLLIAARVSNALFLALVAVTIVTRFQPLRKSAGIEPRLSALLGTFMLMPLAALPRPDLPPAVLATSSLVFTIGM